MRDIVTLGRYTGNRIQEYEFPARDQVLCNPGWYRDESLLSQQHIILRCSWNAPRDVCSNGHTKSSCASRHPLWYSKNRNNGQVLWYHRDTLNPNYCPVVRALSLVQRAIRLGQSSSYPLCVYLKNGVKVFLTANDVTNYFRYTMKLAHPNHGRNAFSNINTFIASDSMHPPCRGWKTHLLYQVTITMEK
jgi:hypothetical protein